MQIKKVCVIGLGYIGLPTAALLSKSGYQVSGVDLNIHAVEVINQGGVHIAEPDLESVVKTAVTSGRLRAFTEMQPSDIYMICVPTPFHHGDGIPQPNIDYVLAATKELIKYIKAGDLIILESTSPVGTTQKIAELIEDAGMGTENVHIAYCPERVLPGKIMNELINNDRVVGGLTSAATEAAANFYRSFVLGAVLETDSKTAEMCKLTENSFRDLNIAFANELSMICDEEGINVWDLIGLANRHPRVNILQPGVGVGGHCIAVDPWFIVARNPGNSKLIRSAREVNNYKTKWVIGRIKNTITKLFGSGITKPKIACLGLTFKPDVDDLRESPALHIALQLKQEGYEVMAVEPNISNFADLSIVELAYALEHADVIAILVGHKQFKESSVRLKLLELKAIDLCGIN